MMIHSTLSALSLNITDGKHGDCENSPTSGYYFISCKDVRDGTIHYEDARQITERDFFDAHKRTLLEPNDILITNSGTIGRMAFVTDTPQTSKTTFQKSVAIVKPNPNKIIPKYLYYVLLNSIDSFITQANGSAQKNLLLSTMRSFNLFIDDDKQVQARIASILSAYDDLIENNQKQIKLLEEAAQRLYKEWFVDLRFPGWENTKIVDGVPEGWHIGLLSELISVNYGKDHKKVPNTGDIPVYGSGGIMRKCNKSLYSGESVLIPRKGSLNNIMYVNESFWTVDTMFFTIPQKAHSAIFTYFFVSGIDMYSFNIGAAVPSMTVKILDNLSLVIPDSSFFEKFDMFVQPYFKKIKLLRKENHSLTTCRNNLLYHLFRSEHT